MRKSRRIGGLLGDDETFGRTNEDRVEVALSTLQEEGQIVDYIRSEPHGELDKRGIDFLVYPESDWLIPLQVKSSVASAEDHRAKYGPNIPCIIVFDNDTETELKESVLKELGLSIKGILLRPRD
ncbi:MAG: hypothetical protein A3G05_00330 [Candidatus Zambryskibacteria bacterium RIFCSPLOWO2_12_FULL_45_14]|uniref:Uncharacterized protein n=2 Tax=Candidatus Zambryskiibacteriota TaxID=1817925 RepID=A0A1G2ULN0_9BACT|nr:MAG: hypothetical protein A3H60_02665 [Candidatus Zambryskibacteria bacterium RIFCSPLOWO2_02_FULL_44_12b]OHB13911.1 MAG: hypothetical protein A3G05_00330 [Candidatus Zambryskibacteria bacterium RIFCSPLOWO2_12_FULL_45_14]